MLGIKQLIKRPRLSRKSRAGNLPGPMFRNASRARSWRASSPIAHPGTSTCGCGRHDVAQRNAPCGHAGAHAPECPAGDVAARNGNGRRRGLSRLGLRHRRRHRGCVRAGGSFDGKNGRLDQKTRARLSPPPIARAPHFPVWGKNGSPAQGRYPFRAARS